jgi:hydrogenase nickel incorporation protein HypB
MVDRALHHTALAASAATCHFFFIENVGNLVCPAIYDLGQSANVVALSVTEGVDKPLKYPVMFRHADLVLLTKCDLLPHLKQVSAAQVRDALARVMPRLRLIELSAATGSGLDDWVTWLESQRDVTLQAWSGAGAG